VRAVSKSQPHSAVVASTDGGKTTNSMSFLVSESSSVLATEVVLTINALSTTWLRHLRTPTSTVTTTTSKRQRWMWRRRNVLADSRMDPERARSEVLTTCTSSEKKRSTARIRMLDRKVQAVAVAAAVAAVDVADQAGEDRAAEDRAEVEGRVEEGRAEAAAALIVVLAEAVEAGAVVEVADVAEVAEAEEAEASRNVHTICLFHTHASIATKEELVRASFVDLLCSFAIHLPA
jgi:hypothetical protein